jgi:hypothetical protein
VKSAFAAALIAGTIVLAGCGGGGGADVVAWQGSPRVLTPPTLPGDRILTGEVRNASRAPLYVQARDVRLVDDGGRRVPGAAIFSSSYAHRIQPLNRPDPTPPLEQQRKGIIAQIAPGSAVPLTVSWHEPKRSGAPVKVQVAGGSLRIPGR